MIRAASKGGQGPTKLADLDRFQGQFDLGYQAVKSGEVVVVRGAGMKGEGEAAGGGGEVIAYEKDAPTKGGYVLFNSGAVKNLPAAEFTAAPKAAGTKK